MLQSSHFAPLACLCCLHDTGLEPTHGLLDSPPVDGVPLNSVVGSCTSHVLCLGSERSRHLPCLLCRLARCSRDERPDGSLPACAWGDMPSLRATPIRAITARPSLPPSS